MFTWLKRLGLGAAALSLPAQSSSFHGTTRVVRAGDFRIELDLSGQVLRLSVPESAGQPAPPSPTPRELIRQGAPFISAALLAQKAKQFDDGLYAALELALQRGAGRFAGKRWLLETVASGLSDLAAGTQSTVPGILLGAEQLGGLNLIPPPLVPAVRDAVRRFQADRRQSTPLSFYTWSEDLRRIFLQDRMLQQELTGAPELAALIGVLRRTDARAAYELYLDLTAKLTNPAPADKPDLRSLLASSGVQPPIVPDRGFYFFPPSRSLEAELVAKLYGNRPIPDGFNLAAQLISGLRAGSLNLQPRKDSGWYDLAIWALEPLILTGKMPEAKRLSFDRGYLRQLEELFKGLLALTRETHVKQLEAPEAGAAPTPQGPSLVVQPELSAEPLYSYYLRRAAGYRFLRSALENALGAGTLRTLHRITADGPLQRDLDSELLEISGLFHGASIIAAQELGFTDQERAEMESLEISRIPSLPSAARLELGSGHGPSADGTLFQRWAQRAEQDPDLSRDARMMVPVFYDVVRRKTKVWVFLGWATEALEVSFDGRPPIKVLDRRGRPADTKLRLELASRWYRLIYPVTAELYVSKLLDRGEFQAHCDRYQSVEAILTHLND